MDVSISKHVHPQVVPAGTAGVEPAFARFWGPGAYPLAHPHENKTAPGLSPGRLRAYGLAALCDNHPGTQGSFELRQRVYTPVSLRGCPECHASMIGVTHRYGNNIFTLPVPGLIIGLASGLSIGHPLAAGPVER